MGPPPFGDGNGSLPRASTTRRRGFNGATAFRRWKPPTSGGRLSWWTCFNGATAFRRWKLGPSASHLARHSSLQWGHRLSAMETCTPARWSGSARRFNGATAFRRWKRARRSSSRWPCTCFNGATAFRRWKRARRSSSRWPCTCFNGATAFRRWKLVGSHNVLLAVVQLQWGHRLSAMETYYQAPFFGYATQASMGPPPFGDGNFSALWETSSPRSCFNGATAFRRWKPVPETLIPFGGQVASMGPPPFGDGNMPDVMPELIWEHTLQWGHRLSAMETIYHVPQYPGKGFRFNGATAFRRWKRHSRFWAGDPDIKLQWGHRLSAMETCSPSSPARTIRCFNGATAFRRWKLGRLRRG